MMVMMQHLILVLAVFALADSVAGDLGDDVKRSIERRVRDATLADFDEHVREYALAQARQAGTRLEWWDIYGQNQHLKDDPNYHKYKISAKVGPVKYGAVARQVELPKVVYSNWFHNAQANQVISTEFKRETQRKTTYTWNVQRGLKIGTEISMSATIPGIMDVSGSISSEVDLRSGKSETKEDTETFHVSYKITVNPQTSLKVDWTIVEQEVDVEWEADIFINGWLAMWFYDMVDDHYLWFHPIWLLSDNTFLENGNGLMYHATGTFRGVKGIDSVVRLEEHPLQQLDANGQVVGQPGEPLKVWTLHQK